MLQPEKNLLITKEHFEALDGLRGIAAIAVVVFHFMEIIEADFEQNLFAHGYLAVDFFFCLSGFVIAYAYDQRMGKIGLLLFIKLRLIRLHPLVIIGAVIGLLGFWLDPFSNLQQAYGAMQTLLLFFSSGLLIPYPIVNERYNNLFHLNAPSWTLFFEYLVNLLYALLLFRLTRSLLYGVLLIAAGLLVYAAYTWGHLSVGWSSENLWGGAARVLYSFVAGMLIFRNQWILRSRLGFGWAVLLLVAAFMVPFTNSSAAVVDPVIIFFYFPFLIALGAGITVSGYLQKCCRFFGAISYPLYMIHYPFIWIFYSYVLQHQPSKGQMGIISVIGTVLLVLLAWMLMIILDIPIRKRLTEKFVR